MSRVPYVHLDASLADTQVGQRLPLGSHEVHHLTTVLRLPSGASVEVADGQGRQAPGLIVDREVELTGLPAVIEVGGPRLAVAQAVPKGRRLDEAIRQMAELGVDEILPLATERTVTRLSGPRAERALHRWQAIVRNAAEQARRPSRPRVHPVRSLGELDGLTGPHDAVLIAHPGAPALPEALESLAKAPCVWLVVGPEGGLTDGEVERLCTAGGRLVGLGPTLLRSEHAGAAGLAVLAAGLGRWQESSGRAERP